MSTAAAAGTRTVDDARDEGDEEAGRELAARCDDGGEGDGRERLLEGGIAVGKEIEGSANVRSERDARSDVVGGLIVDGDAVRHASPVESPIDEPVGAAPGSRGGTERGEGPPLAHS